MNRIIVFACLISWHASAQSWEVSVVAKPANDKRNDYYHSNQAPLVPQHLVKLPVGAVKPGGWLLKSLELQRDGLTGQLGEISAWLTKKNNAWLNKDGTGDWGWEEMPYWLKGYANIGYVLNDKKMIDEAMIWINGTLNSQRDNGDFGPFVIRKSNGKRDLWAQMLMLFVLQSYYEYSNDARVLNHMTRYFKWQLTIPENDFLVDYWENSRGGDNLYSVYWLYNHTKEPFLLELAEKVHRNTANWRLNGWLPNWHNVNIAQCFREPATYYQQSKNPSDLQASYNNQQLIREMYGQVPGGMWGGDENSRKGFTDPRQAVETCGMVEQMASDEIMMRITGDTYWAENAEDVAFNTFPAAFMPDYRSLRYLVAPNMVSSDSKNHNPGIDNPGPYLMMNPFSSRCCQHNHTSGWVYYAENLWMATPDNGLAAAFYADSEVKATVGDKAQVIITTQTRYPFEDQVRMKLELAKPAAFALYFRIPAWAANASVKVNNQALNVTPVAGQYVRVSGTWKSGDAIALTCPMKLQVRTWEKNKGSVSVSYGPLTYALKIAENYVKFDSKATAQYDSKWQDNVDQSKWPAFEILPGGPWNYALTGDLSNPEKMFTVIKKPWPADNFPFTQTAVPIELKAKGALVPGWSIDQYGLCGELPQSPVSGAGPVTDITLIPMGAARLRISSFPVAK